MLIIIHELGHVLLAYLEKVEIKSIYLYPLGGISKLNIPLNISPLKEIIILIAGPLFQFLAYFILLRLMPTYKEVIKEYHFNILLFNLLPIYPLDGGKLLKILLELFLPFQISYKVTIYIGYIVTLIIFLSIKSKRINAFLLLLFLIVIITKEKNKKEILYEKFLLERYLNSFHFPKSKIINNEKRFYRNSRHLIKENEKYYLEREYLEKKYQNR